MMLKRPSSVTTEFRLRALAEARREARRKLKNMVVRFCIGALTMTTLLLCLSWDVFGTADQKRVIRELQGGQKGLEKLLSASKGFTAVFWYREDCGRPCRTVLNWLETVDFDDVNVNDDSLNIFKTKDKKLARAKGVTSFPALSLLEGGKATSTMIYGKDLLDEEVLLDFLATGCSSLGGRSPPGTIEGIDPSTLFRMVDPEQSGFDKDPFVAALFVDSTPASRKVLLGLETIEDEAQVFQIRLVKVVADPELAQEYFVSQDSGSRRRSAVPALVYFRRGIPLVYDGGDLEDPEEVLEWLIHHQQASFAEGTGKSLGLASTATSEPELDIMLQNVDHLLVLFEDRGRKRSKTSFLVRGTLEGIRDHCDEIGVSMARVDRPGLAQKYGVTSLPSLVYFRKQLPSLYGGNLADVEEVTDWVDGMVGGLGPPGNLMTGEMLATVVALGGLRVAALFYDPRYPQETKPLVDALGEVMTWGPEAKGAEDASAAVFARITDSAAAAAYGFRKRPALVLYDHDGLPNVYTGQDFRPASVLEWIAGDHAVQTVNGYLLDKIVSGQGGPATAGVVALFTGAEADGGQALRSLASRVDEELAKFLPDLAVIEVVGLEAREKFGLDPEGGRSPTWVYFRGPGSIPNLYDDVETAGKYSDADRVVGWVRRVASLEDDSIEHVTPKMLARMIEEEPYVAVYLYDKSFASETKLIRNLETIDDDLDKLGVPLVKLTDDGGRGGVAERYGVDVVPSIVLFRHSRASVFKGEISDEGKVMRWIQGQLKKH